ncbi:MAG: ATP-dependent RNA helicase DeaD [Rhodothermales bacterium]|jgi:ATP-dependent RNA helicase DeaD
MSFSDLGLNPALLSAVETLGYTEPSPIQSQAIPVALAGDDLVGLSQTGSGKTAAFALPILQGIDTAASNVQALVLCPTRELAVQVCREFRRLGADLDGLNAVPLYGGDPIERQLKLLRTGPQVIVGTPGRLLDHLKRKRLKLDKVGYVVLDEADRMLDMGFREDMELILSQAPDERQNLFFSATMNKEVAKLIKTFSSSPKTIEIAQKTITVDTVAQSFYSVQQSSKREVLARLVDMMSPQRAIVFCNTKVGVDACTEKMLDIGYVADKLHGDIAQSQRERVLARFRAGDVSLLIATDVAARGLDVDDIDIVFNYDLPYEVEDYVHRIGRTGRAGREGKALTFVTHRENRRLQAIERYTSQPITREKVPTLAQVDANRADQLLAMISEQLSEPPTEEVSAITSLFETHEPALVAQALFTLLLGGEKRTAESIAEDRPGGKKKHERKGRDGDEGRGSRESQGKSRGPREKGNPDVTEAGMARLVINVGKKAGVLPGEVAAMVYNKAGIPDGTLGRIMILPRHTFVDVPEAHAKKAMKGLHKAKLRGRPCKVDVYRPRDGSSPD